MGSIDHFDLRSFDLNLLVAFDALMAERNVTRAAARVGVSQPAMSAALSRLRLLLGDPLFHRSAEGLLPTPRARELAAPIQEALAGISAALIRQPDFVPLEARLTVNLGLTDYAAFVVLPPLMEALGAEAPGICVQVHAYHDRDHAVSLLDAGAIDAAIGVAPTQSEERILAHPILRDEFITVLRSNHPAARRGMNLKTYLALSHALASPEGQRHGLVDEALAPHGKQRTLSLTLPQMFALPAVIARTDMAATVMKRVASHALASRDLAFFPPPVALPDIVLHLIWHRRADANLAQAWLRGLIERVAAAL